MVFVNKKATVLMQINFLLSFCMWIFVPPLVFVRLGYPRTLQKIAVLPKSLRGRRPFLLCYLVVISVTNYSAVAYMKYLNPRGLAKKPLMLDEHI